MKDLKGKIELAANLSVLVVAALVCVVLVKSYLVPAAAPPPERQVAAAPAQARKVVQRGDPVGLPGMDWQRNGQTLLLALSTTCHYCTRSGPFYRRVVKERGGTQLVALLPQGADEGQAYLRELGVDIADVRNVSLGELGLSGTPTLVLVDGGGRVADVWVGALPPDKQDEVLNRLRAGGAGD